jgi:hypothetical protein
MKKGNGLDYDFFDVSREKFERYHQNNIETLNEVMEIGFKYGSLWQNYLNDNMQRLSNATELSDVIAAEAELATEYTEKFNETGRHLYEVVINSVAKQIDDLQLSTDIKA